MFGMIIAIAVVGIAAKFIAGAVDNLFDDHSEIDWSFVG